MLQYSNSKWIKSARDALSNLTAKDDFDVVNASFQDSMINATPSDVAVIFRVMNATESDSITESCLWLLSLVYDDDVSSSTYLGKNNSSYNLIVANLESLRSAMRQHGGKSRQRIQLYGFRIIRSLLAGLQMRRYDMEEHEKRGVANGSMTDILETTSKNEMAPFEQPSNCVMMY